MRLFGLAFWIRATAWLKPKLAALCLAVVCLALSAPSAIMAEASRPELSQDNSKQPLPFSSEAEILASLGQDFEPIRALFLNIALAQLCGLKTKQVETEYLARRAQLVQRKDLDFDTLKALRYLSYISLERTLRSVQPAQLRPWCDAQSATLKAYFQPRF